MNTEEAKRFKRRYTLVYPLSELWDNPAKTIEAVGYLKALLDFHPECQDWVATEIAINLELIRFNTEK